MILWALFTNLLAVLTAALVVIITYYKWSYQYWKKRNMPFFEPSIPFGNILGPTKRDIPRSQEAANLYKKVKALGHKHFGIYQLATPYYFVVDLDLLKQILLKDFDYFVNRGFFYNEKDDPLSCHLFALNGQKWKKLRSKVTPTFSSGKMKAMFQTLVECGLVMEGYMEEIIDRNEIVDIRDVMGSFSTDVVGSCAFGLECNSFKDPDTQFLKYSRKTLEPDAARLLGMIFSMNFPKTARLLKMRQIPKDASDFFTKVVNEIVEHREKSNSTRKDFLQMMIDMKNGNTPNGEAEAITMKEIQAQSFVFFVAGLETTATTMTFALFEMSLNTTIQDKVREEINEVLGRHDNLITYDSMSELKYMGQVIDETLRKYPPVHMLNRDCTREYRVPGTDIVLEEGTKVLVSVLGIHQDEEYYPNPSKFDPDRFSPENKKTRHPFAHIPFGAGPRVCIGDRFGIMQVKVALTCLLRRFRTTVNKKTIVPIKLNLNSLIPKSDGGIWLNFERL